MKSIRSGYADRLEQSPGNLRVNGYDPTAIQALDAPESPVKPEEPIEIPSSDTDRSGGTRCARNNGTS
ncbi:hypothetical protein AWC15_10875 [Mycobacterium lacus]|nr:hypothetical protein AWC15_10875 [Mycobacterium lacus]